MRVVSAADGTSRVNRAYCNRPCTVSSHDSKRTGDPIKALLDAGANPGGGGAVCAIATSNSSTSEQINAACDRLAVLAESNCQSPAGLRP